MIPFVGYMPDADPHLQGVITDCTFMIPTVRGYKAANSGVAIADALASECRGASYVIKLDRSQRVFSGTQTALYELSGSSWVDVSKVGGYTGSTESYWRFCQFGDVTICVNLQDATQKSVLSGSFSDLAGAPKAKVIETVGGFVMVANYNDGTDTPDGIYWSGYLDYTDWTPAVSTQCGYLRMYDTPGEFTALRRLGQFAIAYKENSMYLGQNYGPPTLWGFELISGEIGALSQESVISIETAHFFIGKSDIYVYDGSRPVSVGDGIREWFFSNLNTEFSYKIKGTHDRANSLIYWYFPDTTSVGVVNNCIIYNYKTGKWGRAAREIEACLEYLSGTMTYSLYETGYPTYDDTPSITYGSPFWTAGMFNFAVFDTTHTLKTLNGPAENSSITTGAIGDDEMFTLAKRVQPRFSNDPVSGSMTNYYALTDGSSFTTDQTVTMGNGRFDVLRAGRWHKFKMDFTGAVEVLGNTYKYETQGSE